MYRNEQADVVISEHSGDEVHHSESENDTLRPQKKIEPKEPKFYWILINGLLIMSYMIWFRNLTLLQNLTEKLCLIIVYCSILPPRQTDHTLTEVCRFFYLEVLVVF